jgi:signal transduction histidine kinase
MMFASLAFIAVGAAIIGFTSWSMLSSIDNQIDAAIARDCADMTNTYSRYGYTGLRSLIDARASRQPDATRIYRLIGTGGDSIGNIESWPEQSVSPDRNFDVDINRAGTKARVRKLAFDGGVELLVGRTLTEREDLKAIARRSLLSICLTYLVLGCAAGALIAKYATGRLETINAAARKVLDGDLSVRAQILNSGDEYDDLAKNFNAMLDRIQRLIGTIRGVTENIAHDLRAPLNRIRSRLELSLMSPRTPEEYQTVVKRAIAETENIVETFDGMLKIGRITSGALDLPCESVDLAEIATQLFDLYDDFAEETGVTLEVRLPPAREAKSTSVLGDGHLISQAAANLLDNAIKFSPRGGHVSISVTNDQNALILAVADQGPGIPEDKRTIILERYVRLESASLKPGYGLGLSFVLAVAEWHKAELTFEDCKPGLRVAISFMPMGKSSA